MAMRAWAWAFPAFFFLVGAFFAVLAFGSDRSEERLTFWIIAASFAGSSLLVAAVYLLFQRTFMRATRLMRSGKQAPAQVTRVDDTGVTVNQNPRIHLWLKVRPVGEPEFEVDGKRVVSRLSIPGVGSTVLIRYDPAHPEDFVFDTTATATGSTVFGADPASLEAAVRQALNAKGVMGALQDEAVQKTLTAAASGQSFVDLREYTHADTDAEQPQPAAPDPVEQIERLAKLRDSGAITEGEFIAAKTRLLSDL